MQFCLFLATNLGQLIVDVVQSGRVVSEAVTDYERESAGWQSSGRCSVT